MGLIVNIDALYLDEKLLLNMIKLGIWNVGTGSPTIPNREKIQKILKLLPMGVLTEERNSY